MKARFSGSCGRCLGRVEPGDDITRDGRSRRWRHRECPSDDEARGWWGRGEYPTADRVNEVRGFGSTDAEWYGEG